MKIKILYIMAFLAAVAACQKAGEAPPNPYNDVDYQTPSPPVDTLQPNTLVWLHKNVLKTRCAAPGCHDGNFEPDFRTVESSFATLVYHPVVKNNQDSDFVYRVVPYDTANSVLHERITNCCFVGVNDRMPQDNIGVPLEQEYINAITAWIMAGAPDMMGEVLPYPNKKPVVSYYYATNSTYTENLGATRNRIDTVYYNPFMVDYGSVLYILPNVTDDNTALNDLKYNKLRTSYNLDDFSAGASGYGEYNAVFTNLGAAGQYWVVTINTSSYAAGNVVYMRYYTQDDLAGPIVEMPKNEMLAPYKTYWSFYLKP